MSEAKNAYRSKVIFAAAVSALVPLFGYAGTSNNTNNAPTQSDSNAGAHNDAVTISLAGQTALRNFTGGSTISLLDPQGSNGTSIVFHTGAYNGTSRAAVTYYNSAAPGNNVQLANPNFTTADQGAGANSIATAPTTQVHSALRVEWQEKGSLDGFYDLVNDQIGYRPADGPVSILNARGPSTGNPIWINASSYTTGVAVGNANYKGFTLSNGTGTAFYDTYSSYEKQTGKNLAGGANRVQIAIGEFATENFAYQASGTSGASFGRKPGEAGYGLGNTSLKPIAGNLAGQGSPQARQSFNLQTVADFSEDKVDPESATGQTYGQRYGTNKPWNTAGAANVSSEQIAATAVTFSANPGTGLERLNLSDAQWLQTAGRLSNGADFNNVSRVANTGQRNVLAINTGVDPTWAVGENDGGDTSNTANANTQKTLGSGFRYSGKSSGTESRNAIAQSRLGVGALSVSESRGASSTAPTRALDIDFVNSVDQLAGGALDTSKFTRLDFDSFVNFKYKAILISQYNTIKAPNQAALDAGLEANPGSNAAQVWASLSSKDTGIKGDPYGDVRTFINNITGSISNKIQYASNSASIATPADGLLANGYALPGLLNYKRVFDGGPLTATNLTPDEQALQDFVRDNYKNIFTAENIAGYQAVYGSSDQTVGSNAFYGALNANNAASTFAGGVRIPITAKDAAGTLLPNGTAGPKGNYLFGNFNQDGRRDYASVRESVNAAKSLYAVDSAAGGTNNIYTGASNGTAVASLSGAPGWATTANTKGDLIVLGDYNTDGAFDGRDLLLLARGQSLADSAAANVTHLNTTAAAPTFADRLRDPNAVLRKNDSLDYIRSQTASNSAADVFLRKTAETAQAQANDAANNYQNAFNKLDVDHNGKFDRNDAAIVDKFAAKDFKNLNHQLAAVINDPYSATNQYSTDASQTQVAFNLVDANLTDGKSVVDRSDFNQVRVALGSQLIDGDVDFSGSVDINDLTILSGHWSESSTRWGFGDIDGSGAVDINDLTILSGHWLEGPGGSAVPGPTFSEALADVGLSNVPEPTSMGLIAVSVGSLALRRRRNQ